VWRSALISHLCADSLELLTIESSQCRGQTLLGRAATLEDVGNVAAFAASDRARTMTAATLNVSCGTLID
jgi:enoyl-[acyl-carrier-protein] reductase (NADH)